MKKSLRRRTINTVGIIAFSVALFLAIMFAIDFFSGIKLEDLKR